VRRPRLVPQDGGSLRFGLYLVPGLAPRPPADFDSELGEPPAFRPVQEHGAGPDVVRGRHPTGDHGLQLLGGGHSFRGVGPLLLLQPLDLGNLRRELFPYGKGERGNDLSSRL
jgi:hypothetical protein